MASAALNEWKFLPKVILDLTLYQEKQK